MKHSKDNRDIFQKAIFEKVNSEKWNSRIAENVMSIQQSQRERKRKLIQYGFLPVFAFSLSAVIYVSNYGTRQDIIAGKNNNPHKIVQPKKTPVERAIIPEKNNFNLHIIDVVFNKLQ